MNWEKLENVKKFVASLDTASLIEVEKLVRFRLWRLDVQNSNDTRRPAKNAAKIGGESGRAAGDS